MKHVHGHLSEPRKGRHLAAIKRKFNDLVIEPDERVVYGPALEAHLLDGAREPGDLISRRGHDSRLTVLR